MASPGTTRPPPTTHKGLTQNIQAPPGRATPHTRGPAAAPPPPLIASLTRARKWPAAAMGVFVTSSPARIGWGFLDNDSQGIGWQNVALLVINTAGVKAEQ